MVSWCLLPRLGAAVSKATKRSNALKIAVCSSISKAQIGVPSSNAQIMSICWIRLSCSGSALMFKCVGGFSTASIGSFLSCLPM